MRPFLMILFICIMSLIGFSQEITYSQPQSRDVIRSLNFEVIGKINNNYLIYKNIRAKNFITVFDKEMKIVNEVDLKVITDEPLNVDFVVYPDFAWLIYQYQRKGIVYCKALKINEEGKLMKDPIEIDTTSISFYADKKIYSTIASEDKSKIMVYKIQKKNGYFNFTTLLLSDTLELLHKSRIETDYDNRKSVFSDFFITNSGDFVFARGNRGNSRDNIEGLDLITKGTESDSFELKALDLKGKFLDEIKLKVDNINKNYVLNSFYYANRRGNVEGMYTAVVKENDNSLVSENFAEMSEVISQNIKNGRNNRTSFNDFFIRNIVLKKDGGFLLTAEDYSTQSRSSPWNRYDYLYGYPSLSPYYYNYYSPYSYGYYGNRYGGFGNSVRYFYSNILVMSMDNNGRIDWAKVIRKNQFDDDNDNYLSYVEMLTGGKLHFLFNVQDRQKQILSDQNITGTGEIERSPPLHNLDKGYEFMPRYGKQVSANELIVPCTYRNYISFARIEY